MMKYAYKNTGILVESGIELNSTNFSEIMPDVKSEKKPKEEKREAPKKKPAKANSKIKKG